jgi:hypothetical protein
LVHCPLFVDRRTLATYFAPLYCEDAACLFIVTTMLRQHTSMSRSLQARQSTTSNGLQRYYLWSTAGSAW